MRRAAMVSVWCSVLFGCALFSKGEVATRRYFSPESVSVPPAEPISRSGAELRLGRVSSNESLGARIVYRDSAQELGFYDDRLWTERPEAYVRRALTRTLFEERGLRQELRGPAPTLDVELIAFEEVRAPLHVARVTVAFSLNDGQFISLQQTVTVDRPIVGGAEPEPQVARAVAEALATVVAQIATRVEASLAQRSVAAPPPAP